VEGHATVTSLLIVAQVIIAVVLAVTAGLFTRTFAALTRTPPGFDTQSVLTASVNGMAIPVGDRNALFAKLASVVANVPGVAAAGVTYNPPLIGFLVGDLVVSTPASGAGHQRSGRDADARRERRH
jgi:hypothetical protein